MKEEYQPLVSPKKGRCSVHCVLVAVCLCLATLAAAVCYMSFVQLRNDARLSDHVHADDAAWTTFKNAHGKKYSAVEDLSRKAIFLQNLADIIRHNADPTQTYKKDLYHFHDWTPSEMDNLLGAVLPTNTPSVMGSDQSIWKPNEGLSVPDSVDHRVSGCMPAVKDQGQCGSCWAFSAVAPLEYQYCRKFGNGVSLSEQQLVDCSADFDNHGCQGGFYTYAWQYINKVGGIESNAAYPYTAMDGECMFSSASIVTNVVSAYWAKGEPTMRAAVAQVGPISVAIFANANFMQYRGGVFKDSTCPMDNLNHAVNIVGYGTDPVDGDYWIVRNSWGREWGENGYIRMARGVNICNINYAPAFPNIG